MTRAHSKCRYRRQASWFALLTSVLMAVFMGLRIQKLQQQYARESALAESYAETIERSSGAIVVLDYRGRVLEWNRGARKLFGWTYEEMRGNDLQRLVPADMFDEHAEALQQAVMRGALIGKVHIVDCTARTRSGKTVPVLITVRMLTDRNLGKTRFLATIDRRSDVHTVQIPRTRRGTLSQH